MKNKFMLVIAIPILLFNLVSCGKGSQLDSKDNPDAFCKPYYKEIGPIFEYPNSGNPSGEKKKTASYFEFKTAAGFKMRVPTAVGGLSVPNSQCEMQAGQFIYRWINGALVRDVDFATGNHIREGEKVEIFLTLGKPGKESYEKRVRAEWKMTDAFPIPGNENIWLLPFAGFTDSSQIPRDRNDRSKWVPTLLFKDAMSFTGADTEFLCYDIKLIDKEGVTYIDVPYVNGATRCMGFISFYPGAGGRLDIYGKDLLNNIAPITNAIVTELNSYIVKE